MRGQRHKSEHEILYVSTHVYSLGVSAHHSCILYRMCLFFTEERKIKMSQWEGVVQIKISEILGDQHAAAKGGCVCLLGRVWTCKVRGNGSVKMASERRLQGRAACSFMQRRQMWSLKPWRHSMGCKSLEQKGKLGYSKPYLEKQLYAKRQKKYLFWLLYSLF